MPIITISRLYGSGGSEVAARVAKSLGWTLLDNEVVDEVAERLGMTRAEVTAREGRVPSIVERLAAAKANGQPEMMPGVTDTPPPPSEERLGEVTRRESAEAEARRP